ncbi:MAG: hypothetical protein JSR53_17555 [Proteobacteria bacterium]|nr:hypothetical protein [Pseudomonadota bacterium]
MTQRRSWFAAAGMAGLALALLAGAGTAQARSDVYWSVGVGAPGVAVGLGNAAPVYYAPPPPVYYAPPPPVYYAPPRPVYYAPPPPVVYAPPPPMGYYGGGWGHRHHHHHRRDWR